MRRLSSHSGVVFSLLFTLLLIITTGQNEQSVFAEALQQGTGNDLCAVTPYETDGQARYRFVEADGTPAAGNIDPRIGLTPPPVFGRVSSNTVVVIIDNFTRYGYSNSHGYHVRRVLEQALLGSQIIEINYADIGYTADDIRDALATQLDGVSPNQSVIVNMSFAFMPCSAPDMGFDYRTYIRQDDRDLVDYVGGRDNVQQLLLQTPGGDNPLRDYLGRMKTANPRFVAVGAAGNFGDLGYSTPFYPALWPEVVSVSAYNGVAVGANGRIQFVSNPGEVQLSGGWFELQPGEWHIGSSFAAPLFSAWIAIQYANGNVCNLYPQRSVDFDNLSPDQWTNSRCGSAAPVNPNPPVTSSLDMSLPANYQSVSLQAGFDNDPYQVQMSSGGPLDASSVGCLGFVTAAPDVELTWRGQSSNLRIFFSGPGDTTLVINDPAGNWICDDDSGGNTNPLIDFPNAREGVYDIWVGTFGGTQNVSGQLNITERNILP